MHKSKIKERNGNVLSTLSLYSAQTDTHTTTLEVADNFLLAEGARYLAQMLKANFTIQNLVSLSWLLLLLIKK